MADRDYIPLVADMLKESEKYRDTLSADRIKAIEYYDGIMKDTPSDKGRSAVVSRDVRAVIKKAVPPLVRTFLGSDRIAEFDPVGPEDEAFADQAGDYINNVVFRECGGEKIMADSIHNCLKLRNAIVKWDYEEKKSVQVSRHTGLDEMEFAQIVAEPEVEVLEHSERVEMVEGQPATVHDFKVRRTKIDRKPVVSLVALENFLIHPDATDEDTAPLIGTKERLRRSDLVAMGYDKDQVWALPKYGSDGQQDEAEELTRRTLLESGKTELAHELEEIDYYELYVRIDLDGDGIAELRRMCFGGKVSPETELHNEEVDEVQMAIIAAIRQPHQWEGVSLSDDVMDLQRVKTVLWRRTLDNLYWQNDQQIAVDVSKLDEESISAVTNPQFGQAILMKPGARVQDAIQPITVPFVADKSFGMMEYVDNERDERTGITDASGGLPPDALQNVTAKASALMEQQGIGQVELMARTLAVGFRRMFRGLLRLVIKHQDKPRTVRLRGKWVTFDPRQWNADMDCTINIGLGSGTRERDMMTMGQLLNVQKEVIGTMGEDNPYVTYENLGNALTKFVESTGLKNPDQYVTKPSPEAIQQWLQMKAQRPNPEEAKIKAEIEGNKQIALIKAETDKHREVVQSQAAVEEAKAIAQINAQAKERELELERHKIDTNAAIEREKIYAPLGVDPGSGPISQANQRYEQLMQAVLARMNAPRQVRTPDGEIFTLEDAVASQGMMN